MLRGGGVGVQTAMLKMVRTTMVVVVLWECMVDSVAIVEKAVALVDTGGV